MLQLSRRISFGVDVGNFLKLQCAFKGNRVMASAPEEKCILFRGKTFRPLADLRFEFEHFGQGNREVAQGLQFGSLSVLRESATKFGENQRQQVKRGKLRAKGLGRCNTNLGAGPSNETQSVFAHQ